MKRTGKLFALLAAIVMALVLVPRLAWADTVSGTLGGNGSTDKGAITIQNYREGETYTIYKLFDLASFTDDDGSTGQHNPNTEAYSYVIDLAKSGNAYTNKWATFLLQYGADGSTKGTHPYAKMTTGDTNTVTNGQLFWIEKDPITINNGSGASTSTYHVITPTPNFANSFDDLDPVTIRTGTATGAADGTSDGTNYATGNNKIVQNFAQEAIKFAKQNSISPSATLPNNQSYAVTNLDLGYYVIGTTMGTLASLDTTNNEVTIYEKNDEPGLVKKLLKKGSSITSPNMSQFLHEDVYYASDDNNDETQIGWWVDATDADVGDYIQFKTVISAQQGAKNYELHDVMEPGLQLVDSSEIGDNDSIYTGATASAGKYDYSLKVYIVRDTNVYTVEPSVTLPENNRLQLEAATYTNFTLTKAGTGQQLADGCDFEILFKDATDPRSDSNPAYGDDLVQFIAKDAQQQFELLDIQDGDEIVVTYWAQLTQSAIIYGDEDSADENNKSEVKNTDNTTPLNEQVYTSTNGNQRNTNSAVLTYGNKSQTAWDHTDVTTYQFDIAKTTLKSADNKQHLLADAKFSLYKAKTAVTNGANPADTVYSYTLGSDTITYYYNETSEKLNFKNTNDTYLYQGDVPSFSTATNVNQLTSTSRGVMNVRGLDSGIYILVEDAAPNGYNKLSHPIVITISGDDNNDAVNENADDGKISLVLQSNSGVVNNSTSLSSWKATMDTNHADVYTTGGINVVNQAGQELPSTGGLGTKAFYAIGGSLFAASVIFLLTKKRLMQAA